MGMFSKSPNLSSLVCKMGIIILHTVGVKTETIPFKHILQSSNCFPASFLHSWKLLADSWCRDYLLAAKNSPSHSDSTLQSEEFQLSDQETWQQEAPSHFALSPYLQPSWTLRPIIVVLNYMLSYMVTQLVGPLGSTHQSTLSLTVLSLTVLSLEAALPGLNPSN